MVYKNNKLYLSDICLENLVKNYKVPTYVYSKKIIDENLTKYKKAFKDKGEIFFALKSNSNQKIMSFLNSKNIGIDAVSAGEIKASLEVGFKPDKIIFSGVGKTEEEIKFSIKKNINQINVESPGELERIGFYAKKLSKTVPIGFRFNPDVNPNTHPYITTGFRENKFGMDSSFVPILSNILKQNEHLDLKGITLHIGSQLLETDIIGEAVKKTIPVF